MAPKTSSIGDRLIDEFLVLIRSVVIIAIISLAVAMVFYAAVMILITALATLSSAGGMLGLLGLGIIIGIASLYGYLKWRHII